MKHVDASCANRRLISLMYTLYNGWVGFDSFLTYDEEWNVLMLIVLMDGSLVHRLRPFLQVMQPHRIHAGGCGKYDLQTLQNATKLFNAVEWLNFVTLWSYDVMVGAIRVYTPRIIEVLEPPKSKP